MPRLASAILATVLLFVSIGHAQQTVNVIIGPDGYFEMYGVTMTHEMSVTELVAAFGEPDSIDKSTVGDTVYYKYSGDGFYVASKDGNHDEIGSIIFVTTFSNNPMVGYTPVHVLGPNGYDFSGSPRAAILNLGEPDLDTSDSFLGNTYR